MACYNLTTHLPIYALHPMKGTSENSVDPDQMLQNMASDQGLHWLH